MLECLILGDSIAVGVSQVRTECVAYAKSGINSHDWNAKYISNSLNAKTVIISLGSNDHRGIKSAHEMDVMRRWVKADKVIWILPVNESRSAVVKQVALKYNDAVLEIKQVSKDKVHPTGAGYRELAKATR